MKEQKEQVSMLVRACTIIVDKRNGFFLFYIIAVVVSLFSRNWVAVNDNITDYLSEETETRQGLTISDEAFKTFGMANVMVSNITYEKGEALVAVIETMEGVDSVVFDQTEDHYKEASALFLLTFNNETKDQETYDALMGVLDYLEDYDVYVTSEITEDSAASLEAEMAAVFLIALVIILAVLLFTSKTYMEIPVLVMTFGVAALINMGTHFMFGEISFVSNSIAVVLQLALAIDYAIILCHRFTEEREHLDAREAAILALSKAIPEISSSSMTTVSGMMALMFMQFKLGYDMGMVLIKALLFSLLVVFTLMPGLLMVFSKWMDKTGHKNFVPEITGWGRVVVKTKYIIPPLFVIVLCGAFYLSNQTNYVFGTSTLTTHKQNESQIAKAKIKDTFGSTNLMAIVVPEGDYDNERALLERLDGLDITENTIGLANTEAMDGYTVTDKLTPREFSELTDVDIEVAELLYRGYAVKEETYGKLVNGLDEYDIPLIEMFTFIYDQKKEGYVDLDPELDEEIDDLYNQLDRGRLQLNGDQYSRLLLQSNIPEEGDETNEWLDKLHDIVGEYYDEAYIVGLSTSNYDLGTSFAFDNILISVLSALFVMTILLFTFKSAGVPVLLVMTIQGSIWLNFSFPPLQGDNIYFMSYLVVTSIQMGATIDYAIVITSRYMELKKTMSIHEAMITSLNQAFPTIVTSGTILASAGVLIGRMSSDYVISSIGVCLGRGTIISLILVMAVLPQTLLLGDKVIEKTAFVIKRGGIVSNESGNLKINGKIRGYVNGYVDGQLTGSIRGNVRGIVDVGSKIPDEAVAHMEMLEDHGEEAIEEERNTIMEVQLSEV